MILHLFGGSFDPPHVGHIAVAKYFSTRSDLVLVSPLNISHDKSPAAPADLRLHMCELAFQGIDRIQVSAVDIEREGITYTIDTVQDIQTAYANADIHVVIGADALSTLREWKNFDDLSSRVTFDVVLRSGFTPSAVSNLRFNMHDISTPAVSSTTIRDVLRRPDFEPHMLDELLTMQVKDFILKNRLYQA